jgi:hypothetical protein
MHSLLLNDLHVSICNTIAIHAEEEEDVCPWARAGMTVPKGEARRLA